MVESSCGVDVSYTAALIHLKALTADDINFRPLHASGNLLLMQGQFSCSRRQSNVMPLPRNYPVVST